MFNGGNSMTVGQQLRQAPRGPSQQYQPQIQQPIQQQAKPLPRPRQV